MVESRTWNGGVVTGHAEMPGDAGTIPDPPRGPIVVPLLPLVCAGGGGTTADCFACHILGHWRWSFGECIKMVHFTRSRW